MQKFTGRQYLQIDIASNYGLDKVSWHDRLGWFEQNEGHLRDLVHQAKEPALFFAGILAWEATQRGEPTGYMIGLDGTASGMQLLAALTGDRKAAELCNVISTGSREDAYTRVYDRMCEYLNEEGQITRDDVKGAIMTSLYGSKAVPKEVFGEGSLLDLFYFTMAEMAPAVWELNEAFLSMWNPEAYCNSWVLPDNFHVHVKVMSTAKEKVHFLNAPYEVTYKVNEPMEEGRSLSANTTHSVDGMVVREVSRRCDYDPVRINKLRSLIIDVEMCYESFGLELKTRDDNLVLTLWNHYQHSGYLSARILDHLNEDNLGHVDIKVIRKLVDSLPAKPFHVASVHDRFSVLANYGNDLRHQYNLQLQLIAKSNLLSYLVSQIVERPVVINKLDDNLWVDIIDSDYALS